MDGFGTYYLFDGCVYTGEWKRDKMHGYGSMSYVDGSTYQGDCKNTDPDSDT